MQEEKLFIPSKKQCVFATYHGVNRKIDYGQYRFDQDDLVVIKEKYEDENGKIIKRLRLIENFERPFWVTKKQFRTHKDKREWESLDHLMTFRSTQCNLSYAAQKALGERFPDPKKQLRMVARSPYIYGLDLSPTYIVKEAYTHKYKGWTGGFNDVCFLDIETDVLGAIENQIILITICMNNEVFCYVVEDFVKKSGLAYDEQAYKIMDEDLPIIRKNEKDPYTVKIVYCKDELEVIKQCFEQMHIWKPDYITGWNVIAFDAYVIAERLVANGQDPALYFSDPSIPNKYKGFRFREGKKFSVSDSGKKTNLRPIQRWHEIVAPASFQWIDAMATYYQLRKHHGMEPSYKLDSILEKNIKLRKYEIPEAQDKRGLNKHVFMQRHFPVHYLVYNIFDVVGLDLLDKKTKDIRSAFSELLGVSDYRSNQSNPSKLVDAFQTYLRREERFVLGSTSDQMFTDWDKLLPPLDGWIVALPTTMLSPSTGMNIIKEAPWLRTNFNNNNGDFDITSSYPIGGIFNNISRETTELEVHRIEGVSMEDRYLFGLNQMAGCVNAVSNARIAHKADDFIKVSQVFDECFAEFEKQYIQDSDVAY